MRTLPTAFVEAMKKRLEDQYPVFMDSYDEEPAAGLRLNTLKITPEAFDSLNAQISLGDRIPWTKDGYYTMPDARPGKHPYYHAGFYYIQEPSAMAPVNLMNVNEGDRVLDLCAAPGGKSVQIAAGIGNTGVLVTNDIHPDRTKVLARNMELYGVNRAVVLNERPERIAQALPQWFDKVLVDAPCSGEGMFRKDPDMVRAWEREPVLTYAAMQQEILDSAAQLVKPGGTLVYSTCTFSPEENEASIARFLTKHPDYEVVPVKLDHGFAPGRPDWAAGCMEEHQWEASKEAIAAVAGTVRIWPHLVRGEGHYVAVLKRACANPELIADKPVDITEKVKPPSRGKQYKRGQKADKQMIHTNIRPKGLRSPDSDQVGLFQQFRSMNMTHATVTPNAAMGDYLYDCPVPIQSISALKVVRPGWFLGMCKNNRFEPAHALALGLKAGEAVREYHLTKDDEDVIPYLRGDTLTYRPELMSAASEKDKSKGYVLVMLEGSPLGFAKRVDHMMKNEYPAAWRWT